MGRRNRLLVGACLVVGCGTILRASGASALTATDGPAAHHQTGNLQKGCCANPGKTLDSFEFQAVPTISKAHVM